MVELLSDLFCCESTENSSEIKYHICRFDVPFLCTKINISYCLNLFTKREHLSLAEFSAVLYFWIYHMFSELATIFILCRSYPLCSQCLISAQTEEPYLCRGFACQGTVVCQGTVLHWMCLSLWSVNFLINYKRCHYTISHSTASKRSQRCV